MALTINGRFFENEGEPFFVNAVTYGPFPPDRALDPTQEFPRIAQAGFNTVRTYQQPSEQELDLAASNNLLLFPTVPWHWDSLFLENPDTLHQAKRAFTAFLSVHANHPGLGALLIANEIRPDLVRFMGPQKVRKALEELINHCHQLAPNLPVAYANFPTTEYLEPRNADFTAFNVYLENQDDYRDYLRRLHNIAGDRPLLLTEFGYNTFSEPILSDPTLEDQQAQTLTWAYRLAKEESSAGFTVYSWSDLWFNGGQEVTDWSFGLTRRDRSEKPALTALSSAISALPPQHNNESLFTIAICTRNGASRLCQNLPHFEKINDPNFELLIVDDGSNDETPQVVKKFLSTSKLSCRMLSQSPSGLSAARNHAAREGKGEFIVFIDDDARPHRDWLTALRQAFSRNPKAAAAGGPNLPPKPISQQNAVVTACAGNASHILFNDTTAEHLPGCNFALRRELLLEIGGFDPIYHAAGDDVDLCWRLLDHGHELAFHPAACVFHDRRPTIKGFLRQQRGYGEAEGLLYQKHPQRFGSSGIRWEGFIYNGSPLTVDTGAVIYHGPMGSAPYQMVHSQHMPIRPLHRGFDNPFNRKLVRLTEKLASHLRRRTRKKFQGPSAKTPPIKTAPSTLNKQSRRDYPLPEPDPRSRLIEKLQESGWKISKDEEQADLERGPIQLILAQTPLEKGQSILHLRLLHPPIDLIPTWTEFEKLIKQS